MDSPRNNKFNLAYEDNTDEQITSQRAKYGAFRFEDHIYFTTLKISPFSSYSKAMKE